MAVLSPTEQRLLDLTTGALQARRGVEALAALHGLPEAVREAVSRLRALQVSDLMYLDGVSSTDIAAELADRLGGADRVTHSALRLYLSAHGPSEYLTVEQQRPGVFRLARVPITTVHKTRAALAALSMRGVRIVPARWEIDPENADAGALWARLGG